MKKKQPNNTFPFDLAPNVAAVQAAIEYIYPLVYEFRKERVVEDTLASSKKRKLTMAKKNRKEFLHDPHTDEEETEGEIEAKEEDIEDIETDGSWD